LCSILIAAIQRLNRSATIDDRSRKFDNCFGIAIKSDKLPRGFDEFRWKLADGRKLRVTFEGFLLQFFSFSLRFSLISAHFHSTMLHNNSKTA
jgi:hypothetical protein